MKKSNKQGFTLIELMIVVAIIAIIAAIAIPNLLRSRMQSNESSAIGNLRTIVGSQVAYHAANYVYTAAFADLTGASPAYLDGDWTGTKSGYNYTLGGDADGFTANADPSTMGTTGSKGFFTDGSGVIRYAVGAVADAASAPLGEAAAAGT
jgi:prepilin-type N-terminal cleavage/methylation domain-containing protein